MDEKVVANAIRAGFDDFEDGVTYSAALAAGTEMIVTRNVRDFKRSEIPIIHPDLFKPGE